MRSMRFGLQARFLAAMAIMLAVVLALLGTLLHRQKIMQQEVADLGRDAMHSMVEDSLRRHGEATVDQLGDALKQAAKRAREVANALQARWGL